MTEFCVTVLRKPIEHRIRFNKVQEWVQPSMEGSGGGHGEGTSAEVAARNGVAPMASKNDLKGGVNISRLK
jgi:hypothetical protein